MRAPDNEATGTAGESEVASDFQRLGWGAIENARHDLGTDLFLAARDERRFDLGLLVGAQVKAGPTAFSEPKQGDDGDIEGWWYRDSDGKHIEAWLEHSLPHLIVLRNMDERVSYWAHVTHDAVVSTGKGAKILVPRAQIVSADQREALLKIARTQRPSIQWEGSIWTAGAELSPRHLLRYALVVPRLVAPHPNAGVSGGLSPEQGIAMLMQARAREFASFAQKHDDVPSISEAAESSDWRWRFAHALHKRLITDDPLALISAAEDAPSPDNRAAATVTVAAAFIERNRSEEAVDLLSAALDRDDAEPVDHAWLQIQRARARAEIGQLRDARADALAVVGIRSAAPHDATATAFAGAAANLLFETSGWGATELEQGTTGSDTAAPHDATATAFAGAAANLPSETPGWGATELERAITGSDTAATWWRQQTTARGLGAIVARTFGEWAADTSTRFGPDDANNQTFAASLLASHVGSQGGWRHLAGLVGCNRLMELDRHADPKSACDGLNELRLAGAAKEVTLAARRLATNGPATAITMALSAVDLDRSSRTTAKADLALLKIGGHLADTATAARAVGQLLEILDDRSDFLGRATASSGVRYEAIEALAGVIPGASGSDHEAIRDYVLALDGVKNQIAAKTYGKVVEALPASVWDERVTARARQAADGHDSALSVALLGVAAPHDAAASERLIAFAQAGSLNALSAFGDVSKLPADVASTTIERLATNADGIVAAAQNGTFSGGGVDVGSALVILNAWHPDSAKWDPLLRLLDADVVSPGDKHAALDSLEALVDRVPTEVREALVPIALRIARGEAPQVPDPFGGPSTVAGRATRLLIAVGGLDAEESADRLVDLLLGGSPDRRWAAHVASRSENAEQVGVLVALSADADPTVRVAAATGLARAVVAGEGGRAAERALQACIADPGALVPNHVAATLREAGGDSAEELLGPLRQHPSGHVRTAADGQLV